MHCLIVLAGLPGTGKTTVAKKLSQSLGYQHIDQNEARRGFGFKRMPKTQDSVLRQVDKTIAGYLNNEIGVIFDSVNRYSFRRQHLYGIASGAGVNVILIEVICSEKIAKKRIRNRSKSDGLLSDPNNVKVYDKLKKLWEEVDMDFKYPGNSHVSYIIFDSEKNKIERKSVSIGMRKFVNNIEKILTTEELNVKYF